MAAVNILNTVKIEMKGLVDDFFSRTRGIKSNYFTL